MKKNIVDLFVAKDRTTLFWFLMACGSIFGSALWVQVVLGDVRTKPQYVIMDGNGIYYLAPSVELPLARDMHIAQTRLAMQTLFERGPLGLVFASREPKLFTKTAMESITNEILKPDSRKFKDEDTHQTIEVTSVTIEPLSASNAANFAQTTAKGLLTRVRVVQGKKKTEHLTVSAVFLWQIQTRMADTGTFPTVCRQFKASDPKIIAQ